jgi:threonine dehydrogenase-like Zn-dependent dehydrogenase
MAAWCTLTVDVSVCRAAFVATNSNAAGGNPLTCEPVGDRIVNPFPIACGACYFCHEGLFSLCENSNPNAWMAEELWGRSPAGLFGYSHMLGGYAGGQAEYVRIPFADVGPIKVPAHLSDEQVLFLCTKVVLKPGMSRTH